MDMRSDDRPHYPSREDLAHFVALNTALWIFDVDRHAMWWANPRAIALWRAPDLDALLARDYSTDSEAVRIRLRQIVDKPPGDSRIQETWTVYPDETPTTFIVDMQPVRIGENGNAVLFEASRTLDLSDDPETLRILEVARSSALMVSSFTMSGVLLAQNPASHACYARTPVRPGRCDLSNRFVDADTSLAILKAVEAEGHLQGEFTIRTGRGERIHRITARKGRDPVTGDAVMVLNEEDMTEQVILRKTLQRLNDDLETRVAERTESLLALNESLAREIREREEAEDKLRHAQKMEAIGKLTGGVAHDFNNLLAVIVGNAELLEEQTGAGNELLGSILRAAMRGAELTRRLLAFSRRQPLQPRPVDLGVLVSGMSGMLSRTLGETIDVRTYAESGLWMAMADPGQVEDALLNLALNARDAMPEGGTLRIVCGNTHLDEPGTIPDADAVAGDDGPAAGDYIALAVTDSGTGMPAAVQEQAFEPFFTTKDVGKGSGLGLSMVYGFARQSGGHAAIHSQEGRGTTINLYLPRAETPTPPPAAIAGRNIPQGRNETILILEDEADVRALAEQMLNTLGYRTITAGTAAQAEQALSGGATVDLVLSDVVLPGGTSGPEFARRVRMRTPDLKFIFMSGYPAESQPGGLIESGETLIGKPFQRWQLAEALHKALA